MRASEKFDPYRKWLGIPPAEQPPNHYRLLGVGLFEDDADTIAIAADRQMAHIRTFQTGPNSALSQTLLNELAATRLVLLDPKKKAAYDEQLRAKLRESASIGDSAEQGRGMPNAVPWPPPAAVMKAPPLAVRPTGPVPVPVATAPAARGGAGEPVSPLSPADVEGVLVTPPRRGRSRRSRSEPALWAGVAVAAAVLAAVVYRAREQLKDGAAPTGVAMRTNAAPATSVKPRRAIEVDSADAQQSSAMPVEDSPSEPDSEESRAAAAGKMPQEAPPTKTSPDATPGSEHPAIDSPTDAPKPAPEKRPPLSELLSRIQPPRIEARRRDAVPDRRHLPAANARVSQLYGKQIANAKGAQAARKLAFRFFDFAREGADTSDVRYALLNLTGLTAAQQGNVGLAYRVAAEVAQQFDVDPYALKLTALEATGKNAGEPAANAVGVLQSLALAQRAAAAGKNDLASKAADLAVLLARKTKDKDLMAQADQAKAALREQSSRNAAYQKALIELKKLPENPEANLAAGKYEVLVLGDSPAGLMKLATSGDPRWLAIAEGEALGRIDLSQWAPLATAWWQMADSEQDEFFQLQCRLQAKYCCFRARQTGRAGEVPAEIAEQLKVLSGYAWSRLRPGVAARYYEGERFGRQRAERSDPAIDFNFGEGSPDPTVPNGFFSARWTGFFKPPLRGRYLIVTYTDDSIRLWIDGQQVLDRWRQAARWQQVELELTAELHTIQMDYNDTVANAVAMLGWTLAAFPDPDHVQWSPIDALYYDPESPFDLPELP